PWLNDPQYYHNRGNSNFSGGEDSIYGDFVGLDDIATDLPFVREQLIDIYQGWVGNFGVDGFRLDTAQHVQIDFWTDFAPALLGYAQSIGKNHLTLFGEAFTGDTIFLSRLMTEGELPSLLNFPLQFRLNDIFNGAGTDGLEALFAEDDRFIDSDSDARDLVNFFGNHDIGRAGGLLRDALPTLTDEQRLAVHKLSHAMLFFLRGVPTIYYGDEQGFVSDAGDQGAREDMMPSLVPSYNDNDLVGTEATTAASNFDQSHPLYRAFAHYARVFRQHKALRHGVQIERLSRATPGLYVVSRIDPVERVEYLVAFNTSASLDSAAVPTATPATSWYAVWPPGDEPVQSDVNADVAVSVPGYGFAIYRAAATIADAPAVASVGLGGVNPGQAVTDIVQLMTDVPDNGFRRVYFEHSVDGAPFEFAGEDYTYPYRLYWNTHGIDDGSNVTLRAVVGNPAGDDVSTSVELVVDHTIDPPSGDNPYGVPVFVRGSFNGWGLSDPLLFEESTATMNAQLNLAAGSYQFKIASEDWATADFGSDGLDPEVVPGTPKTLVTSSNNLVIEISQSGAFLFSVDVTEPQTPVLTVQ
ncbi:MAG: hypothetical protein KJO55_07415, partial [Gammaproteobacteria bacterium]|nr:hypothetical protein [Gammaproteobacteria bacterium]